MEQTARETTSAVRQLTTAQRYQRSSGRRVRCLMGCAVIMLVAIIIVVLVKTNH